MRMLSLISTLLLVGSTAVTAADADLTKIDRSIAKEPVYKSKPMYCLLVFGPEAETRVWLVLDGETLYVDRNGNGNLTEDGERLEPQKADWQNTGSPRIFKHFFNVGDIAAADRKTKVGTLWVLFQGTAKAVHENECIIGVGALRVADVRFAGRTDAPILHFAGPLTFRLFEPAHFVLGQEPRPLHLKDSANWLRVRAGTPGLGNGPTFVGCPHDDTRKENQKLEAQADIDFPCKDGLMKRISFKLTDTCCCGQFTFEGPVRVPDEAISGKAKIIVSFPDSQKVRIAPATFEVPIVESRTMK